MKSGAEDEATGPEKGEMMEQTPARTDRMARARDLLFRLTAVFAVIALCAVIFVYREQVANLGNYGYAGAFLVALVSSATVVVPVPGVLVVFALGAVLNPWLVGLLAGLGSTLGETSGYLLGYSGHGVIENTRLYRRIDDWVRWRGEVALFILAAIPNPIFDIAGAAAGALRMPFWKFMLYGGAGRTIKHILFAFAGAWGFESVISLL
jgi:membrane protein YqaA with SNARE-associated domain